MGERCEARMTGWNLSTSQCGVGEVVEVGARHLHLDSISVIYYIFNHW